MNQRTPSPKANWSEVKAAYQRGEGSCRELAERFGLSFDSVRNKCHREKWQVEKAQIDAKVTQKVTESLAKGATEWVDETIKRVKDYRVEITKAKYQMEPAIDPVALLVLAKTEKILDDLARRAYGLPDKPDFQINVTQSTDVHPELREHLIKIQEALEEKEEKEEEMWRR